MDFVSGPWAVILLTALVTYALRIGGFALMARVPTTPRVTRALDALPGSIFVATVVPIALKSGVSGTVAVIAAGATMYVAKREMPALAVGFAVAAGLRAAGL